MVARNGILAVVLAALVAATVALDRPSLSAREDGPLFAFDPAAVSRVLIEEPGGARVELVRGGGRWGLASHSGFPAVEATVVQLVGRVAALRTGELASERVDAHASYGVGEDGVRVVLTGEDGALLAAFVQGIPPDDVAGDVPRAARSTYVRPADGDAVFRSPLLARLEADPRRWMATRLVEFPSASVASAVWIWRGPDGRRRMLDLLRGDDGSYSDVRLGAGRVAPHESVRALLDEIAGLYGTELHGTGYRAGDGFGTPPELQCELTLDDGSRALAWIGNDAGGGHTLATNPSWEREWVVLVPAASVARIRERLGNLATLFGDEDVVVGE